MARPRSASVGETTLADGSTTYWAKITVAAGDRRHLTLGTTRDGMDRAGARRELARQQAQIALGQWRDPRPAPPAGGEITFHAFASEWFGSKSRRLSPNGIADCRWRLTSHLLPFFGAFRLAQIDGRLVERYIDAKLSERDDIADRLADGERLVDDRGQPVKPLSNTSINKTLETLSQILAIARKRGLIDENAAAGERLRVTKPRRTWLMPDQVLDLIEAAERIDRVVTPVNRERAYRVQTLMHDDGCSARQAAAVLGIPWSTAKRLAAIDLAQREASARRAIIAALVLSGLRASELCALMWRHVDFANGRIVVPGTKTDAAQREVKIVDYLRAELERWRGDAPSTVADALVFPTLRKRTHRPRTRHNLNSRVVAPAVREANRLRELEGLVPLPERVTPHTLRRTFAALMLAANRPTPEVQYELGHEDARTTLNIYAQVMRLELAPSRDALQRLCRYSTQRSPLARRTGRRLDERGGSGVAVASRRPVAV